METLARIFSWNHWEMQLSLSGATIPVDLPRKWFGIKNKKERKKDREMWDERFSPSRGSYTAWS